MKLKIEIDNSIAEEEIIIRCQELTANIQEMKDYLSAVLSKKETIAFYKGNTQIYIPVQEILFFETSDKTVCAHTIDDSYEIHNRLYELEDLLPHNFVRVSKSTILNVKKIFSIDKNLYASSLVCFRNTHKQVYVSRHYYKMLTDKIDEIRQGK